MKFKFSNTALGGFRRAAIMEGVSFLLLLFIGMPMKYIAHLPQGVKVFGWMHGLLFIIYIVCLIRVKITRDWSFIKTLVAFVASLLPFGTFILDVKLRKEEKIVLEELPTN